MLSNFTQSKPLNTLGNIQIKAVGRIFAFKSEKLQLVMDKIFDYTEPEAIIALSTEVLEMLMMIGKENE